MDLMSIWHIQIYRWIWCDIENVNPDLISIDLPSLGQEKEWISYESELDHQILILA